MGLKYSKLHSPSLPRALMAHRHIDDSSEGKNVTVQIYQIMQSALANSLLSHKKSQISVLNQISAAMKDMDVFYWQHVPFDQCKPLRKGIPRSLGHSWRFSNDSPTRERPPGPLTGL